MDYNDENFINNLVDKYKEEETDKLQEKLLNSFKPYFSKYADMFCSRGVIRLNNKDTITFLRLFMSEDDRANAKNCYRAGLKYVAIIRKIFQDYTKQDLYNEILIYFLEALKKYKPMIADHKRTRERISFTHYIQVNLRYKLYKLCSVKSRDALSKGSNVSYRDIAPRAGGILPPYDLIDFDWIYGETTGDIFSCLTEMERYLLWLMYESDPRGKKVGSKQLEKMTGLHHKTIQLRFKKIKKKLRDVI